MRVRRTAMSLAILAACLFVVVSPALAEQPSSDCGDDSGYQAGAPWPAFQRCSTRLGISSATGARSADLNWSVNLGANVRSSVVDKDGTIYVGAGVNTYAVDKNGITLWSQFLWGNIAAAPAIGADGTIYVVAVSGALAALDPVNGAYKWVHWGAWGTAINTSPLIGGDGTVYFVDAANIVHAVDPTDGSSKWFQWFPGSIYSSLTMSRDERSLYIGSAWFGLRAIDASNGNIRWQSFGAKGEFSTPTIGGDGTIYVGSLTGDFFALSPIDGAEKWRVNNKFFFFDRWGGVKTAPAMTPGGDVVFGTGDGYLVKVSSNGNILWETQLGADAITGSPAVDLEGYIYVSTHDGELISVDPSGNVDWSFPASQAMWSAPAIGKQGTIYVGSNDNNLYSVGIGKANPFDDAAENGEIEPRAQTNVDLNGPDEPDQGDDVNYCVSAGLPTLDDMRNDIPANGGLPLGYVTSRPGLDSSYDPTTKEFTINGITNTDVNDSGDSHCSAHLCTWSSTDGVAGTVLSSSDEAMLLSDDVRPKCAPGDTACTPCSPWDSSCTTLADEDFVPCEAVVRDPEECFNPDYTAIRYDLSVCADAADCGAGHTCMLVCGAAGAANVEGPQSDCDPAVAVPDSAGQGEGSTQDERTNRCVRLQENSICLSGLDSVDNCYTVTECPNPEDVMTEDDATAKCFKETSPAVWSDIDCDLLAAEQTAALKLEYEPNNTAEQLAKFPASAGTLLDNPVTPIENTCVAAISQSPKLERDDSGGSPTKSKNPKKWGLETAADFETGLGTEPGPLGLSLPSAFAKANFGIDGYIMGKKIVVFSLNATASAKIAGTSPTVGSEAEAKLFGQNIASVEIGADLLSGTFNAETAMTDLNDELNKVGSEATARLAQVTRIYNRVLTNPEAGVDEVMGEVADLVKAKAAAEGIVDVGRIEDVIAAAQQVVGNPATITRQLCKDALRTGLATKLISGAQTQLDDIVQKAIDPVTGAVFATKIMNDLGVEDPAGVPTLVYATTGAAVSIDPICDAPLNQATAKLVMDTITSRYDSAIVGMDESLAHISGIARPGLTTPSPYTADAPMVSMDKALIDASASSAKVFKKETVDDVDKYWSQALIGELRQEFSIIGAGAVFPIGPLALVLEIQGTGHWGIEGKINYGFSYDLEQVFQDNGKPASVFANALVSPYAGVSVDAYVGIGFDFGIGGASVGISGQITLVEVKVPVGGGIELAVVTKPENSMPLRVWPEELEGLADLSHDVAIPMRSYGVQLVGNVQAGMELVALKGTISAALRVKLLFFKKTWRKKIATLAGYQNNIYWVKEMDGNVEITLPAIPNPDDFQSLPSFPFPKIKEVAAAAFPMLLEKVGGSVLPVLGDYADLQSYTDALDSVLLGDVNVDYFLNGSTGQVWDPSGAADPWKTLGQLPGLREVDVAGIVSGASAQVQSFPNISVVIEEARDIMKAKAQNRINDLTAAADEIASPAQGSGTFFTVPAACGLTPNYPGPPLL